MSHSHYPEIKRLLSNDFHGPKGLEDAEQIYARLAGPARHMLGHLVDSNPAFGANDMVRVALQTTATVATLRDMNAHLYRKDDSMDFPTPRAPLLSWDTNLPPQNKGESACYVAPVLRGRFLTAYNTAARSCTTPISQDELIRKAIHIQYTVDRELASGRPYLVRVFNRTAPRLISAPEYITLQSFISQHGAMAYDPMHVRSLVA